MMKTCFRYLFSYENSQEKQLKLIHEFTDVIFSVKEIKKDLLLCFRGASPKPIVSNKKELVNVESRISLHTYAVKI